MWSMKEADGEKLLHGLGRLIERRRLDKPCFLKDMPKDIEPYVFWNRADWIYVGRVAGTPCSEVQRETWMVREYYVRSSRGAD